MKKDAQKLVNSINNAVTKQAVIIITGPSCSGKSWLIEKALQISPIEKKQNAMQGESTRLTVSDMRELANSTENAIAIDECQLLDSEQIMDVANFCVGDKKALILSCQRPQDLPDLQLYKLAKANELPTFHIQLEKWDRVNLVPVCHKITDNIIFDVVGL